MAFVRTLFSFLDGILKRGNMEHLLFLIIYPLFIAAAVFCSRRPAIRNVFVVLGSAGIFLGVLSLLAFNFHRPVIYFQAESFLTDKIMFFLEIVIGLFILWQSIRHKKPLAALLLLLQMTLVVIFETKFSPVIAAEHNLFVDKLSMLMALVIGVIGGLICIYAVGYMRDFHGEHHKELKDNRGLFFFIMFLFLSAMFGIIFSNNLAWLYFFWEVTTVCSFVLIGYKKTKEARDNAFRALTMNLLGGLAFAFAIVYLCVSVKTIELDKIMFMGKATAVLLPVAFMSFAGLTKSAQFPFSSWLLGAMVAPTPVSALLHSSTMVKAGVYIIVRFAAVLQGTLAGFALALIGGITFFLASLIAITHSDAKKVLAYSTIANLGLIVLCAGVGTYEALWAAALLIIFHAVAKCLLFLCVGTIEHKIHSRNIENMSGLIITMPRLSIMMQIGMAGMFLAPFGMLISKWAVLKALVDYNPLLAMFVVFGSSATLFFWVKWMGALIVVIEQKENVEETVSRSEFIPLAILAFLTISVCAFFPLVSSVLIEPYVVEIFGKTFVMSQGNIQIMTIMLAMVMLFPLSFINYGKKVKVVDAYLGGSNTETHTHFRGAAETTKSMEMKNYYLEAYFGEKRLFRYGVWICLFLAVMMIAVVYL